MSSKWWTHSWNPVIGCTPASPGCDHCYAKTLHDQRHAAFVAGSRIPACYAKPFGQVACLEERLTRPLGWKKPRRVFVNSMSDLFHPDVPSEFLDRVFAVMALASQHTFMICTKRAKRMREYITGVLGEPIDTPRDFAIFDAWRAVHGEHYGQRPWPLPNVWLGVTAESQEQADARIPILLDTPAAKRFVSVEPMLGPVDLRNIPVGCTAEGDGLDALSGCEVLGDAAHTVPRLDWVICGGESGPNARPLHPDWARSLRDQCAAAGVPFFFKQWGEWSSGFKSGGEHKMSHWMLPSGQLSRIDDPDGEEIWDESRSVLVGRVGSRRAGRLLDGVEHNAMPEVQS